jgi:outer membrane scaffolding protein for murein synthesis (MipA/OmpV family)
MRHFLLSSALLLGTWSIAAPAQDREEPRRTRVALGPQVVPSYPGSDKVSFRPLIDVARARGDKPFEFEAPDESFGFSILQSGGFSVGPVLGFEGERKAKDVGAAVPKVDFTFEVGGFVEYQLSEPLRVRAEARRGVNGHEGWIGVVSADYVARDKDKWLFSIGPRVTFGDDRYHRAYFGVTPAAAATSGLPAFDAKGGLQAVGATAGFIRQLTPRWGIYSFARYDRLVDDAGRSPIVRGFGSRNQLSGGLALTYTFGRGVSATR